jgi:hypothetical protein
LCSLPGLGLLAWWLLALAPAARGGLPQPMCVYYGQALDGYGFPYRTNADVILRHGTNDIARQTIRGSLAAGVNFALYVHLDDGRNAGSYSVRALHRGDQVTIVVRDADGEKTIMENQAVPAVGQPGELVFIRVTAAEDADRDGLPDPWEREIIAWSEGTLQSLTEVTPGDDFDGDGLTNGQEYLAGTFPFLDYDMFRAETISLTPNHRLCLTVLTTAGKLYSARSATDLDSPPWEVCAFSLSDTGALRTAPVEGDGGWLSLYLPVAEPVRFFRLWVE